ncbi:MAG: nicotinate-nucleotide adenylyltransferase [Lachnospiraceae bacterium]|nr:nicotinate-nucleotide adenylyltransferase [Candidatus Equihabitans merdae]
MSEKIRVGFMGGTFDPIHMGHLILAEDAYQALKLDKVIFMPAGRPPHKQHRDGRAGNEDRARMTEIAIAGNDHFELSLLEMEEERLSYSYLTLEEILSIHPEYELFFIMGADSLDEFHTWKYPERIAAACTIIAAVRDNMERDKLEQIASEVEDMYNTKVILLDTPNIEISSTTLRRKASEGSDLRYYVPSGVSQYIMDKGLYRTNEEA